MGKEVDGQLSLFDSVDDLLNDLIKKPAKPKSVESKATEPEPVQEIEIEIEEAPIKKPSRKSGATIKEGTAVRNIYTGTIFTVLADRGNEVLVRGSDKSAHEMLKADIELVADEQ